MHRTFPVTKSTRDFAGVNAVMEAMPFLPEVRCWMKIG